MFALARCPRIHAVCAGVFEQLNMEHINIFIMLVSHNYELKHWIMNGHNAGMTGEGWVYIASMLPLANANLPI